jgi:hypothetical protein
MPTWAEWKGLFLKASKATVSGENPATKFLGIRCNVEFSVDDDADADTDAVSIRTSSDSSHLVIVCRSSWFSPRDRFKLEK